MKIIIIFLIISNLFAALAISIWGLMTDSYFNDYRNYMSLNTPEIYMDIDTVLLRDGYDYTYSDNSPSTFIIYGESARVRTIAKITIGNKKYFNYNRTKFPVYKSKLTHDNFLKNAPSGYYNMHYRSFLMTMYLKLSLFPILGVILFIFLKHRKSI